MNQDFTPPANSNQPPDSETADWFAHIDAPAQLPPTEPKSHRKRLVAVVLILSLFVAAAVGAGIWYYAKPLCLTPADYEALTASKYSDALSPTSDFITLSYGYRQSSSEMTSPSAKDYLAFSKRLSSFNNARKNVSTNIVVKSYYTKDESKEVADQRSNQIKDQLIENDTSESLITTSESALLEPEEDAVATPFVTLSVASNTQCR